MRSRHTLLISFLLLFLSCGGGKDIELVKVEQNHFKKYVNEIDLPLRPNLSVERNFVNNTYPIEIALYRDHKFYYNLPNLGDGVGDWKFTDGYIELTASRDIFDIYIEVYSTDSSANSLAITFTDRFGKNTIQMINNNLL